MAEELFDGLDDLELGGNYLESEAEAGLIDVPDDGSNPNPEEDPEEDNAGGETKKDEKSEKEQKKESRDVPKELQDLIDTDDLQQGSQEQEEEEEGDNKDTKDSDKEAPDSPDDDNSDDSSPSASVEPYIAFGNTLKEGGSFATFDEEEFKKLAEEKGPHDAFVEMQRNELEKAKEDYKNSLSDEDRQLYEAKEAGVNLNEIGQIDKTIKSYSSVTDEHLDEDDNAETAKAITKEYLRLKGFEDDEIQENIELYEENGTLGKRSKKARDKIVETLKSQKQEVIDNQKQQKQKEQEEIEQKKQKLKQTVNSYEEIIPGIKINDNTKQEVYKDMTTPVAEDNNGNPMDAIGYQRSKNPEAFDAAIYYYNRLGLFNIDENGNLKPDFSKIQNVAETKSTKKLDQVLGGQGNESFKPKGSKKKQKQEETEDLFDGI